eukprot:Nk52_evm5s311 gene=Nk52_evmTU5s311
MALISKLNTQTASSARLAVRAASCGSVQRLYSSVPMQEVFPGTPGLESSAPINPATRTPTVTKLNNGLTVASTDANSPASYISLVINCGSRNEDGTNKGIANYVRNMAFSSTNNRSNFRITREFELMGGFLHASANRESVVLTAEALRSNVPAVLDTFADILSSPAYFDWEIAAEKAKIAEEYAYVASCPQTMVVEGINKAAFREGLGNSIFACPSASFSSQDMKAYAEKFLTGPNSALVATGVDASEFGSVASNAFGSVAAAGAGSKTAAKYFGGDVRQESADGNVHMAIAYNGAASNTKDAHALGIFKHVLGAGKYVKYGSPSSRLAKAIAGSSSIVKAADASAFNFTYSDAGLIGVYATCSPCCGEAVAKTVADTIKEAAASATDDEIAKGKAQYKASILMGLESPKCYIENMGSQLLNSGKFVTPADACAMIDSISAADVKAAAQKAVSSKISMVARGNVSNTPYSDCL